jgi:hypothetical protein
MGANMLYGDPIKCCKQGMGASGSVAAGSEALLRPLVDWL